jgi:RNA polymerase sigma-70 factor (ECF subfamily)
MPQARPAGSDELEAALIARAREGDAAAFERLVERHAPQVWRVVWRILRQTEDAEDVVQEVFLTAWRSLTDFRGDAKLSTWLHQIAVSRALNHVDRAAEKLRRASTSVDAPAGTGADTLNPHPLSDRLRTSSPSPFQALSARERLARLRECLERLPADWRALLALREGEELDYREIASALGIALGTVRSRLARARLNLKQCVEEVAS